MVVFLERGADCLHIVQPIPLHPKKGSLASFKTRLVLPFWYLFTQNVLEKRPLKGCSSSSSSSNMLVLLLLLLLLLNYRISSFRQSNIYFRFVSEAIHRVTMM